MPMKKKFTYETNVFLPELELIGKEDKNENFFDSLKNENNFQNSTYDFMKFEFENIIGCESMKESSKSASYYVEKVSLKGSIWGKLEVRKNCLHFSSENNGKRPENQKNEYLYGTKAEDFIETKSMRKIWKLSDITKVFSRSFNLRDSALEVFTVESKAYFFNIFSEEKRNEILHNLKILNSNIEVIANRRKAFMLSGFQEKWIKNEITNFEYLMQLNTFAGNFTHFL